MIATHNIKVNGRWIRAGEEYGEVKEPKEIKKSVEQTSEPDIPAPEVQKEEPKAETKPKTTRRKTSK